MPPTTLITAIGRGNRIKDKQTYQRCVYRMGQHEAQPTSFFAAAWMASPAGRDIDRVELLGTATSAWCALAEEYGDLDLWAALEPLCGPDDAPGVSITDLAHLETLLSEHWQATVRCRVLSQGRISDEEADSILGCLFDLLPIDEPTRHIHLDTTHAPRVLPLLACSAIQMADALCPGLARRTRLIYGELLDHRQRDRGRGIALDRILDQEDIADATRTFFDSFEGAELGRALKKTGYPKTGQAIEDLGECIHANAFSFLDERLRQLSNARRAETLDRLPYGRLLDRRLEHLHRKLDHQALPARLFALAGIRAERRHYGAALLALAECATALACPQPVREDDQLKGARSIYRSKLRADQKRQWDALFRARNRIAHGANLVDQEDMISGANIKKRYDQGARFLRGLLQAART